MEGTTESARDLCGQLRWYTGGWVVESVLYLGVLGGAPASLHYGHALGMGQRDICIPTYMYFNVVTFSNPGFRSTCESRLSLFLFFDVRIPTGTP